MRIDEVDRRIIAVLVEDSRRSFAVVGESVGLSASAVKRRVDRLVSTGVIRKFTAEIDPGALGWDVEAFVELTCSSVPRDSLKDMLAEMPEVVAAHTVTGEADVLLHVRTADIEHFEQTVQRLRQNPDVLRTRSTLALSTL